jgi:hypothetical protein
MVGTFTTSANGQITQRNVLSAEKKESLWQWYNTSGARCIHNHEGRWTDPNGPYWGGFQANWDFMKTYGRHPGKHISYLRRWGTANHWRPILQIHMAFRGWRARGFQPWPEARRKCGL